VLSDLHLFARRLVGQDCINSLRAELAAAGVLVLNGDIFDFRWSSVRNFEASVAAALDWLRDLPNDFPRCQIHYVLGIHDRLTRFRERLPALAASLPRLHWHEHAWW
jgi:UDP-2,3-diacylglucosamine hydrolase